MVVAAPESAELTGYLSAVEGEAGFLIPLFRARGSNHLLVQEVDGTGMVTGFRDVDPREVQGTGERGLEVGAGRPAIWGFRDTDGMLFFEERAALRTRLLPLVETIRQPFVKLQVAQFCERPDALVAAWRDAYRHLAHQAPKSAEAWRDVVVAPAQMRLAVEEAILTHGLDASTGRLDRSVEVAIDERRLGLRLSPALHAALSSHEGALRTLEEGMAPLRLAFDLSPAAVSLVKKEEGAAVPEPAFVGGGAVQIAAIGGAAITLLGELDPSLRGLTAEPYDYPPRRDGAGIGPLEAVAALPPRIIFVRDDIEDIRRRSARLVPIDAIGSDGGIVFVILELEMSRRDIVSAAIGFAEEHRRDGRLLVAVIPHLPEELEWGETIGGDLLPALDAHFDAIWILSDRSAYSRQAIAIGPSRSAAAAAGNFGYLLGLAHDRRYSAIVQHDDARGPIVGLVGSASGDQSLVTLANHAVMRLNHYLFDLDKVGQVQIRTDMSETKIARGGGLALAEMPNADLHIHSSPRAHGGISHVTLAIPKVELRPNIPDRFAQFCRSALAKHGWRHVGSEEKGDCIASRDYAEIPLAFKFVVDVTTDDGIRARNRRKRVQDGILITNATIRRRSFALQVLNGTVPIHYSRIEALAHIYERRFAYALALLRKESRPERMLTAAGLDFLALHPVIVEGAFAKAELARDADVGLTLVEDAARIAMPLVFRGRSREKDRMVRGHAVLILDRSGWHAEQVEIDQSDMPIR